MGERGREGERGGERERERVDDKDISGPGFELPADSEGDSQ